MESAFEDLVLAGADRMAAVAGDAGALHEDVLRYPGWTVADVVRHTGEIHRWIATIVRERADARPVRSSAAQVPDSELGAWLLEGAQEVASQLRAVGSDLPLWTFVGPGDAGFWKRRAALETTLHRWDAETACGEAADVDPATGHIGVEEALEVYLLPKLGDRTLGDDRRAVELVSHAGRRWGVTLAPKGLEVGEPTTGPDAVVRAGAADLWLFLMARRHVTDLEVTGDRAAVELLASAVDSLPGPGPG